MNHSNLEVTILMLEQTLRNSKEHAMRCERRFKEAEQQMFEAKANVRRLEQSILNARQTYFSGVEL